jgi:hypothetical protein
MNINRCGLGLMAFLVGLHALLASAQPAAAATQSVDRRCELPQATVLFRDGNEVVQTWELEADAFWFSDILPVAPGYDAYRDAIRRAGGDTAKPVADPPESRDDSEREIWRKELLNVELMFQGAGAVRPIRCLEAALFAWQDARFPQLSQPTEFIAHVLRRDDRLKVVFGSSDQAAPPKAVYGFNVVINDLAAGWRYLAVLHNHTLQTLNGQPALGVPVPSTSDVPLFRGLAERLGLQEVWVTNGLYTGVVASEQLGRFATRD